MFKLQGMIRHNSLLLPCVILGLSFLMILAYHFVFEKRDPNFQVFLIVVTMTMIPTSYVDAAISTCGDPNAVFRKFGLKVLLMHALFLSIRAACMMSRMVPPDAFNNWGNITGAISAWLAIGLGYTKQLSSIHTHGDVAVLMVLAFCAAQATELVANGSLVMHPALIGSMTSDYLEVLAFVPGAVAVIRYGRKDHLGETVDPQEYKMNALAFGILVVGFYIIEDVVTAYMALTHHELPFESVAHILHFVVLADFGFFVICSAFDPENKGRSTMLSNFGGALFSEAV